MTASTSAGSRVALALVAVLATSCTGGDDPAPPPPRQSYLPDLTAVRGTKAFDDPRGLAFEPDGDLWVGNYKTSTLARYPADQLFAYGVPKAATVIEGGAIKGPNAMTFDERGYLWVAMRAGNRVVGFTPKDLDAGRQPSVVLPDPDRLLRQPSGVAVDGEGNLWVASAAVGHLVRYGRSGLARGTAKPDIVVNVPNDRCQAVAVVETFLWLGCEETMAAYRYDLPVRPDRPRWATKLKWGCAYVQLAPNGDRVAAACGRGVGIFGVRGAPMGGGSAGGQETTDVRGITRDPWGVLWAGTGHNVIVRLSYDGPAGRGVPSVVLRPRPEAVPTVTTRPVYRY